MSLSAIAVAYLTNLNALEIIAGLNFRAAKDDLANRGLLSAELGQRLELAFRQEMAVRPEGAKHQCPDSCRLIRKLASDLVG